MQFRIEQRFRASMGAVGRAFASQDYLVEGMAKMPDIGRPEVVNYRADGAVVTLALEYRFGGKLPGVVTRVIDLRKLSWIEDTVIDTSEWVARFTITPTHYASFFTCSGGWRLTESAGGTTRVMDGSLKVNAPVPFVGGQVERAIVSGLRERLAEEPPIMEQWLMAQTADDA